MKPEVTVLALERALALPAEHGLLAFTGPPTSGTTEALVRRFAALVAADPALAEAAIVTAARADGANALAARIASATGIAVRGATLDELAFERENRDHRKRSGASTRHGSTGREMRPVAAEPLWRLWRMWTRRERVAQLVGSTSTGAHTSKYNRSPRPFITDGPESSPMILTRVPAGTMRSVGVVISCPLTTFAGSSPRYSRTGL